jgi:selenocysteine lyase/cysteine desulfurase
MGSKGGAVRISFGPFNTLGDVERVVAALAELGAKVAGG